MSVILTIAAAMLSFFLASQTSKEYTKRPPEGATPGSGTFFDNIAHRYDPLNRIISLGMDAEWRRVAIAEALPAKSVLDVSTGTADLAIAVAERSSRIRVVGIDPSKEMLARGREKITLAGDRLHNIQLIEGVAENLPFESESFDAVVVAFGVRNFQNREKGLSEMVRVLKAGGRLVILELSTPSGTDIKAIVARVFINEVMPKVASVISGSPSAYQYLSESMTTFPPADKFMDMLRTKGLAVKSHSRLSPLGLGPDLYTAVKRSKSKT